jgi:hypothetical protein
MKKTLLWLMILVSFALVLGCDSNPSLTNENTTISQSLQKIEDVFQDYQTLIPDTIEDHYQFPQLSVEEVDLQILFNGHVLVNGLYQYESLAYDQELVFILRFTYQDQVMDKVISITQLRDQSLNTDEQIDAQFNAVFTEIRANVPVVMTSDFSLPVIDQSGVVVSYESSDLEIYRNRLLFSFPEESQYIILRVAATYEGQVRTQDIPIRLEAKDQLPQIPEIHIYTEDNQTIESNEDYTPGSMDLFTHGMYEGIQEDFSGASMGIRLRGNSTFFMPKKSYKIKFDIKQAMFTDYAERDWVLLANYADQSLIRTALANHLADDLQMEFVPISIFVDLYINGDYQGNYMLTDQVEATNDRVDIEEGSRSLNTGYLLEWDNRLYDDTLDHSDVNYFFIRGLPFVIKTPNWNDPEYIQDHYYFIEDYMLTVYLTLENGHDYSQIIDERSFIDWFIVNEVFKNVDAGFSSIYFYKDRDALLKMGPIWDFDLSLGNAGHLEEELRQVEGWYTSREEKNKLFFFLMQYPSFRTNLMNRWNQVYEDHILSLLDQVHLISDSMALSVHENFELWDIIGKNNEWYTVPEILESDTYAKQVWFVYDYLEARISWLNDAINQLDDE